jgi:DNA processing protein
LVKTFGGPREVLNAPAGEISAALNVKLEIGRGVVQSGRAIEKAEKVMAAAEKVNARVVTLWDAEYPQRLQTISDPPALLFVKGLASPLYNYSIGVVGTRAPSDHAQRVAFRLGAELAASGVTVVSGMAIGIDSLAHEGALAGGGRTVAVMGTGVDVIYPSTNRKLYGRIVEQGAVMTEYVPGTGPEPFNFPPRNRIISGVSIATVIVEAGLKSGALITAKTAIEQGRDLFAIPGAAAQERSAGVNRLIKDGAATMVETAAEIVEHLKSQLAPVLNVAASLALPKMPEGEAKIYRLLEPGPVLIDEVIQKSGLGAVEVNRLLTSMQLKGVIRRFPGARVGRV